MRRRLGYLLAWFLATVAAVTGSWVGLQPLLAATSPELPARLSMSQLREAAPAATPAPTPTPASTSTPTPTSPPAAPTAAASPTPAGTGSDRGTVPPVPPQPLLPATSQWRELSGGRGYERTFVVRGGEVVFRARPDRVRVVEHTANPGYEVSVSRWTRSSVIFSFESTEHTSRIWVMWRNGPYAEVTETV